MLQILASLLIALGDLKQQDYVFFLPQKYTVL